MSMARTARTSRLSGRVDDAPRLLVQNGEYWLSNKGDLAMLDVTLRRLRAHWPDAEIGVLTRTPALLRAFHPDVVPVVPGRRARWLRNGLTGRIAHRMPPSVVGPFSIASITVRNLPSAWGRRISQFVSKRFRTVTSSAKSADSTVSSPALSPRAERRLVNDASLFVAVGGGYVTDVDSEQAARTFRLLALASDCGTPTAMVGQGLGPLEAPGLRSAAAVALPRTALIALREARRGPVLLDQLGVPAERVLVTGDDAIELAVGARRDEMGQDVGVCLRVADYSPVAQRAKEIVGRVARETATAHGCALVPLIVSEFRSEDRNSTLPLVTGFPNVVSPLPVFATPHEVAARVSRCRVLVTGAYHLAVFALSQGIPVVGLTSSEYYDDKLLGLRDMFEGGLSVVHLDDPELEATLAAAVADSWERAAQVRAPLRDRGDRQVEASRAAFQRMFALVDGAAEAPQAEAPQTVS
jgi:polysaccharide pyruvyl transferase WcaK-like protein